MGNYLQGNTKIAATGEIVHRAGYTGGTQSTGVPIPATKALAFDHIDEDEFEVPEPERKREEKQIIGGKQNVDKIVELGYEAVEKDIPINLQTAIFLYQVMGGCTTVGTAIPTNGTFAAGFGTTTLTITAAAGSYTYAANALAGVSVKLVGATTVTTYIVSHAATSASTLKLVLAANAPATGANTCQFMSTNAGTDVLVTNTATNTITLTNLVTVAENGLAGKVITIAGVNYHIVSNAAQTGAALVLVLHRNIAAGLGTGGTGETVTFRTFPYVHTISEADTTPALILHIEKKTSDSDILYNYVRDLLGVYTTKVVIRMERGGIIKCTASVKIGKSMAGTAQTTFPTALTDEYYTWDHVNRTAFTFTYNGDVIDSNFINEVGAIEITIERELDYLQVLGDEYPYKLKYGTRRYITKVENYTPTNKTLYGLKNTKLIDYTGEIILIIKLQRDTRGDEYIQFTFNSLWLSTYPDTIVNINGRQAAVGFELKNAAAVGNLDAGTLAIVSSDQLTPIYYETPHNLLT